jgi:hypothetical protein
MKNSVSYLALGVGLLTGTLFAYGQTFSLVAQAPATVAVPPSGVLVTQPPAPVAVPPSGVLPTIERRTVATVPVKTAQKVRTAERATPVAMRRHVVHWRPAARRMTISRTTTVGQSIAAAPPVVTTAAATQPRGDGRGYELFLPWGGKEKEAK